MQERQVRSPGGNGSALQNPCLENPIDRSPVRGVAKTAAMAARSKVVGEGKLDDRTVS